VAHASVNDFAGGVWLVELAALSDPALVPQQVAASLGLRGQAGRPWLHTLTAFLCERQVLLVLDNCEHLLAACALLASDLLRGCSQLRLLATSRQPLGIAGEAAWPVPSLPCPIAYERAGTQALLENASVQLFVHRARLVLPDYELEPDAAAAVARICQRLDGIPLAIEMAAARVNMLSEGQIAARLESSFDLLGDGSHTALPRQRTLRATIDWSYDLLSLNERRLFQRLSVFAGGCSLEAVEAVCSGEGVPITHVLSSLASLVEKSLALVERVAGGEVRYRLLEVVRQYARQALEADGDCERRLTRHRDYFVAYVVTHVSKVNSAQRLVWTRRLKAEHENIRQALGQVSQLETGAQFVSALFDLPWVSYQESLAWAQKAQDWCEQHPGTSAELAVRLLRHASNVAALNEPRTAVVLAQRAVNASRNLGPSGKVELLRSLNLLGGSYLIDRAQTKKSLAAYAEAECLLKELGANGLSPNGYTRARAEMATRKAYLAEAQGQWQKAVRYARESVRLWKACCDPWAGVAALIEWACALAYLADFEQARQHLLAAQKLNAEGEFRFEAHLLHELGHIDLRQDNLARAVDYCRAGVSAAVRQGDDNILASCLGLLAILAARQNQPERAATLSGASQAMYIRQKREPWEDSRLDTLWPGWRKRPDHAMILKAFKAGLRLSADQVAALAHDNQAG
jgi:predicted ATPase